MQNHSNHRPAANQTTKERIFHAALKLFYESNYDKVSVRDIANAAGVRIPTIYIYFESKEDILKSLYDFYNENILKLTPDLDELMRLAKTEPPRDVLMKTGLSYNPTISPLLCHIVSIAVREINAERSAKFLKAKVLGQFGNCVRSLLEHMVELGRIKPLDIETFISLFTNFTLSASLLNGTSFELGLEKWQASKEMLFSIIKPTQN